MARGALPVANSSACRFAALAAARTLAAFVREEYTLRPQTASQRKSLAAELVKANTVQVRARASARSLG